MRRLRFGEDGSGLCSPRVANAPARPAPASNRGICKHDESRLAIVGSPVTVAEKNVFILRGQRWFVLLCHVNDATKLVERVADEDDIVQRSDVRRNQAIGRDYARVRHTGHLTTYRFDGGVALFGGSLPGGDERTE